MMKALIVDDEPLARERIRQMLSRDGEVDEIEEAGNGRAAIEKALEQHPDILFLDIQMPDMDGFEVLAALGKKKMHPMPITIFVTAYDEYALKAFEYRALDYLLKPFDQKRFADAFRRAKERLRSDAQIDQQQIRDLLEKVADSSKYLDWITVRKDERITLLKLEEICWIEARGNYVFLKTPKAGHMTRATLNSLETKIDPQTFVRIHRSTIVNINRIKELQVWRPGEYRVVMLCDKSFTMTRGYRERLEALLNKQSI